MALLEATNTLLDFDFLQNSSTLSLSPLSPVSSAFSTDSSMAQWTNSSDDDSTNMTSLKNACLGPFGFPQAHAYAELPDTTDVASVIVSSSPLGDDQLEGFDIGDFTSGFEAGISSPPGDASVPSAALSKEQCKKSRKKRDGNSKARTPVPTSANNKLPPCRICADSASGFHYGVNTCEACKRFFRRALKRKRSFKCKACGCQKKSVVYETECRPAAVQRGDKNCVIKGKKTALCGFCRFKQCLALGMSKTASKTGRYTHAKRAQNVLEVQRLVSGTSMLTISEPEVRDLVQKLTSAHANVITNAEVPEEEMRRRARQKVEEFQLKKEMFGFQDTLSPEQYDEVFQVTGLDVDERKEHMKFVAKSIDAFVHGYVRFGKGVPEFADLSLNDQANLFKMARVEVWFLGAYRGFLKDYDIFYAPNKDCRHRCEIDRLLGKEYTECAFTLASCLQEMDLTKDEVVVLKAVCLTFGDRCVMEGADDVEEIQWRMLRCFLHLIRKNHSDQTLFYKVMNCVVAMRNLTELSRKALCNTHFADAIRSNSNLVDMILI